MIESDDQPADGDRRGAQTRDRLRGRARRVRRARLRRHHHPRHLPAAGVNLALPSYHFGSKEALWGRVVQVLHERLAAIATEALCAPQGGDLPAAVARFLRHVARALLADPRPMRIMVWAQLQPEGYDPALLAQAYEGPVRAAVAFLEAQQAAGRIPAEVDCGVAVLAFYGLLAEPLIEPGVHQRLLGADPSDPAHAARLERHVVRSGLRLLGLPLPPSEELSP
ncbi:MAG: hypothetical protein R3F59_31450 [Myxococcota bacterium]